MVGQRPADHLARGEIGAVGGETNQWYPAIYDCTTPVEPKLVVVVVAEGDYIVQYGVRHGRWHGGRFMGIEADPGDYSRGFAAMFRFAGGQIAERWAVRDDLTRLRHLGTLPPS